MRIHRLVYRLALRVGRDGQCHGAMSVDMIDAALRVVLDDEDGHRRPERTLRQRLDDLAEREIVVGNARRRRAVTLLRPACVVARQLNEYEIWHCAGALPFG